MKYSYSESRILQYYLIPNNAACSQEQECPGYLDVHFVLLLPPGVLLQNDESF